MLKFLYSIFEKMGNLYVWCIGVTCAGVGACVLYGILLDDYLEWRSAKERLERDFAELVRLYEQDTKKESELKLEIVTLEKKKNQLISIEKRLLELQSVIADKQKNDSQLDGAIAQKNQELQNKTKELNKIADKVTTFASELSALSERATQVKEEYEKLKAGNDALTDSSQKKTEELQRLNLEYDEADKKKQSLQTQNNDLQQNLSLIQGRLSASQQEDAQLAERIKTLRSERDKVQKQLAEIQNRVDELTSSRANAKRLEMERNLATLQEKTKAADADYKQKVDEAKAAASELADIARRRDVLKAECGSLDTLKTEKQNALDVLKREYDAKGQQLQAIEAEVTQKNSQLQSASLAIEELQKRKSALQSECAAMEAALKENREVLNNKQEENKEETK